MKTSSDVTDQVVAVWREVLNRTDVDPDSNFFELGGDSLSATVLMVHVEMVFGLTLDPTEVFETPLLSEFADKVAGLSPALPAANASVAEKAC